MSILFLPTAIHIGHNIAIETWSDWSRHRGPYHFVSVCSIIGGTLHNAIHEQFAATATENLAVPIDC